jgi:predicted Zn finger-like uncharacterized protein
MALATRCPHCKTTFRVASDQLKLRGGIVRCGTCSQVFDGNAALVDLDAIEHKTAPPAPAPVPEPEPVADAAPQAEPEVAPEPEPDIVPVPVPVPVPERGPSAGDIFDNQMASIEASSPIVLEPGYVLDFDLSEPVWHMPEPEPEPESDPDDEIGPPTQFAPSEEDDLEFERLNDPEFDPPLPDEGELSLADDIGADFSSEPPAANGAPDPGAGPLPLLRASAEAAPAERAPTVVVPAPQPEHDEPDFVRLGRVQEQAARRRRLTMGAGSVLLALLLLGQGVTTFRNLLVAKYPALKPAVSAACVPLRCKIELPAQIETLVIETGDLQTINSNTYLLTTLLRNESDLTQAWPYIELKLTDGNDKALVRRVFTPPQYLPQGVVPAMGFGARVEQPVKINFELKQLKASGFHIEVFYP